MRADGGSVVVPITDVVVYRSGAVVQRAAILPIGSPATGSRTLTLEVLDLPLCLVDSSVVARFEGPGAPVVTDVAVALAVTDVEIPPRPEQAAVDAARAAERRAQDHISMLQARIRNLEGLAVPERPEGKEGEAPPDIPVAGRLAMLDFRRAQLDEGAVQLEAGRETLRQAIAERKAVEDQQRRATTARSPRAHELRKAAHLTVLQAPAGEAAPDAASGWKLVLEYQVPGARWTPSYSLRFDARLATVGLDLRASVVQRTGEDWTGVGLTVSTAMPMTWTGLPEVQALRIGRRQPAAPRTGWRPAPTGADALYADYDAAASSLPGLGAGAAAACAEARPVSRAAAPMGDAFDEDITTEFAVAGLAEPEPELERPAPAPKRAPNRKRAARPSAPPSPPPSAMPRSAPQASRSGVSKSAGLMASMAQATSAMMDLGGGGGPEGSAGAPGQADDTAVSAALTADEAMLDFGALRLAGPDDPDRGRLRPVPTLQRYRERISLTRLELTREVLGVVAKAGRDASLRDLSLPPDHSWPQPVADFEHAWRAAHPVDVPADGSWHSLSLQRADAPAQRCFIVVPRLAEQVFRVAEFVNPLSAPLPQGPADVFVGEELLLTAPLRTTDRGGTVTLGMGVEEGIKVARNTRFEERTTGLLSGTLALKHHIEIELRNNLASAAEIEVRERIPAVREHDDEVELASVSAEPRWEVWEQPRQPARGTHRWQVTVPAGASHKVSAQYTVELSAKKELVGGNRREGA